MWIINVHPLPPHTIRYLTFGLPVLVASDKEVLPNAKSNHSTHHQTISRIHRYLESKVFVAQEQDEFPPRLLSVTSAFFSVLLLVQMATVPPVLPHIYYPYQ